MARTSTVLPRSPLISPLWFVAGGAALLVWLSNQGLKKAVRDDLGRLQVVNPVAFAAINAQLSAPNKAVLASFAQQMHTGGFPALGDHLAKKSASMPG